MTKKRHYLRETIPAGTQNASRAADKAVRRLQNQVDERRQPRTSATVNQLLDRYFLEADLEFSTLDTYRGYAHFKSWGLSIRKRGGVVLAPDVIHSQSPLAIRIPVGDAP